MTALFHGSESNGKFGGQTFIVTHLGRSQTGTAFI